MAFMGAIIGNNTAFVNGYVTAFSTGAQRFQYRPMLDDVLARIETRLESVGLSASAASQKAGLSKDAIRNLKRALEQSGRAGISTRTLTALAPVLETSPGWLLSGEGEETIFNDVDVPIFARISAGNLRDVQSMTKEDIERYIRVSNLPKGDWFGLTVEGDSMDRIAPEGAVILINRSDDTLIDGKFYVFSLGGGKATFKRYRRSPELLQPFSTNPDNVSIPVEDEDLYVFGRVRRVITDL